MWRIIHQSKIGFLIFVIGLLNACSPYDQIEEMEQAGDTAGILEVIDTSSDRDLRGFAGVALWNTLRNGDPNERLRYAEMIRSRRDESTSDEERGIYATILSSLMDKERAELHQQLRRDILAWSEQENARLENSDWPGEVEVEAVLQFDQRVGFVDWCSPFAELTKDEMDARRRSLAKIAVLEPYAALVGNYGVAGLAYRREMRLYLVDLEARRVVAMTTVEGGSPPATSASDAYGVAPDISGYFARAPNAVEGCWGLVEDGPHDEQSGTASSR